MSVVNTSHKNAQVGTPMTNYKELTNHLLRKPRRLKQWSSNSVPEIDLKIPLDLAYVVQEERDGVAQTPMAKIRYFENTKTWCLVPRTEPGMYVFFNTEPGPEHTAFQIKRLIPSNTACYADPIA